MTKLSGGYHHLLVVLASVSSLIVLAVAMSLFASSTHLTNILRTNLAVTFDAGLHLKNAEYNDN